MNLKATVERPKHYKAAQTISFQKDGPGPCFANSKNSTCNILRVFTF